MLEHTMKSESPGKTAKRLPERVLVPPLAQIRTPAASGRVAVLFLGAPVHLRGDVYARTPC